MRVRVLIVAGSDSGGGAGVQADIKTVTSLGAYAATAITAITIQNTQGVFDTLSVPPEFVARQMEAVLDDIGTDAIKVGMLHSAATVEAVARVCQRCRVPIIVDPLMVAKRGEPLLEPGALRVLADRLFPLAALVTPNAPEAELLTGLKVRTADDMESAAERLLELGPAAVLIKGGHIESEDIVDLLQTVDGDQFRFTGKRIESRSTHGIGCTLASAIAVGAAEGLTLKDAVSKARDYVQQALLSAPGFGSGFGPLDHTHPVRSQGRRLVLPMRAKSSRR
ncbi:MAG TPA: bifunctional hydroxymethylpyrimidine kinase/phosphomethylpyrimidine kinase [Polyangiaceae bacterium]|jgi:hydroxymethylpyrimidine/phosphomethylpyrimidine kinase